MVAPLRVPLARLARALGTSARTAERIVSGAQVAASAAGGPRLYDLDKAVAAWVAYVRAEVPLSPSDAHRAAQAAYVKLKTEQARGELYDRAEIDAKAGAALRATRDRLLRLEHDLERSHPAAAEAVAQAVREALDELAALEKL